MKARDIDFGLRWELPVHVIRTIVGHLQHELACNVHTQTGAIYSDAETSCNGLRFMHLWRGVTT
eukprot:4614794-Amphidinium_carterae.1